MHETLKYKCLRRFWCEFSLIEKKSTYQTEKSNAIHSKKIILLTGFSEFYKPENPDLSNLHQELHKIIAKKIWTDFNQSKT